MSQQPSIKWLAAKIIYLVFFWIVAVIVVLYVAGFRVNWSSGKVSGYSSVSFASYERTKLPIDYEINGEERTGNMPLVINWLTPGVYSISIKTEGTLPWYRSFRLTANGAETFNNILLIPEDLQPRDLTSNESATLGRVDKFVSEGLLIRGGQLFDVRGGEERLIIRMSSPIEQAVWYPKRTHVIVRSSQTIYIMESSGTNITSLANVESLSPTPITVISGGATILIKDGEKESALTLF